MRTILFVVLLFTLSGVLFFYRLGDRDLLSSHEARAGQNARSILRNEQWLLPQLADRQVDLQKPPLYYWLVAMLSHCNDGRVNEWTVRLPSAASALGVVLLVFLLGRSEQRPLAGFLAGAMLATSVHFTWLGRVGRIDMPLTFTIVLSLVSFRWATNESNSRSRSIGWLAVAWLSIGFGLLLKGPVALVIALAVGYVTYSLRTRTSLLGVHRLGVWWGLPLALATAGPWFWFANEATNGDLWQLFFWHHNVARGFGGAEELPAYPFWYYGPRLAIDLLPWSLLLLPACIVVIRNESVRSDSLATYGLIWLCLVTLMLSCLRFKRADYLLPAFPGAAIFLGCFMERGWQSLSAVHKKWLPRCCRLTWVAVVLACIGGWLVHVHWIVPNENSNNPNRRFAQAIAQRTEGPVVFFRVEAHDVAFYIDTPIATVLEWENLDQWAQRKQSVYVVMRKSDAAIYATKLNHGRLTKELNSMSFGALETHDRPLVLMRTVPKP